MAVLSGAEVRFAALWERSRGAKTAGVRDENGTRHQKNVPGGVGE